MCCVLLGAGPRDREEGRSWELHGSNLQTNLSRSQKGALSGGWGGAEIPGCGESILKEELEGAYPDQKGTTKGQETPVVTAFLGPSQS